MSEIQHLADICRNKNVYIQTHNFPDPDAIASAYGLKKLLEQMGVPSKLCYKGSIDKLSARKLLEYFGIKMLSYEQLCDEMKEKDYIICVDSQKNAGNITDFIGDEIACIDHHPVFEHAEYQYSDIRKTGACATIIAEYYARSGHKPDRDVATALLYGIKMDTAQFTRGVTVDDIQMFAFLQPLCDQEKLMHLERNNMEFSDLKAYAAAINSIELDGKMGICYIPFSCPDGLIAAISDFILSLEEVEIAVVCAVRLDGIKCSVRSESENIHAGHLVRAALDGVGDGGGHKNMAGGLIKKEKMGMLGEVPEHSVREKFRDVIEEVLR